MLKIRTLFGAISVRTHSHLALLPRAVPKLYSPLLRWPALTMIQPNQA